MSERRELSVDEKVESHILVEKSIEYSLFSRKAWKEGARQIREEIGQKYFYKD
jgi:hypothetical protein